MTATPATDQPPATSSRRLRLASVLEAFAPNRILSKAAMRTIVVLQVVAFLLMWLNSPFAVLPKPMEVYEAFFTLVRQGMLAEILTSMELNAKALAFTVAISLGLAYLTVMPFFRPLVTALSKSRFLSLVGFTFVLTLIVGGGVPLKTWLLVFGMTAFFVTSMASVVAEIPKDAFDHARTLRMGEWRAVWEVVILGTADKALEVLRQNAAIGWMMLTMVEGISRSEGGIGAMLLNQQKHFHIAQVFAIQITILLVGLFQDYIIGAVRRMLCPYAYLSLERK